MGDFLSEIVSGIVEDLVIGAVNESSLKKVSKAVSFSGSKTSGVKGEKGKAIKSSGKGRPSSGGMVWGTNFGDSKVGVGKGGKAKAVERVVGGKVCAEEKLGVPEGYFTTKKWHQYGHKHGPQVCSVCQGCCCAATREMIEALVGSEVLPAETTDAKVSFC